MQKCFLLCLLAILITGCDLFTELIEEKDSCHAQTGNLVGGRGGGSSWPDKMTKKACEASCNALYNEVILNDTWGYCRFGKSETIWNYNAELQLADNLQHVDEAIKKQENARDCYAFIESDGFFPEEKITWENTVNATKCEELCKLSESKVTGRNMYGYCKFGEQLIWHYTRSSGEPEEYPDDSD